MPLTQGKSSYQRYMEHQRRVKWRDWLIVLLCFIVAIFIGLARRSHADQSDARYAPAPEQLAPVRTDHPV
jgi:hypothetical protein